MLSIYLVTTPSFFEDEDIEIKYAVYKGEELLDKQEFFKDYQKPALVEHIGVIEVVKILKDYEDKDVEIIFNDASFLEQVNRTSTLKNNSAKKLVERIHNRIDRVGKHVFFVDVSADHEAMQNWKKKLDQ